MDFFAEWIVKKKRDTKDILTILTTLIAGFFVFGLIFIQLGLAKMVSFVPFEIAAVVYGMYILITRTNVEFEYSVTNSSLDIDKIISRRKRKRILSVDVKNFEYFAPLNAEHMRVYEDSSIAKRHIVHGNRGTKGVYFGIYFANGEKNCLVFEPTEKMINNFAHFIPRSLNHTI